jgi:predicted RNase H-like nuclease
VNVGIDACNEGWLACYGEGPEVVVRSSLAELWETLPDCETILIDIPIGLPTDSERAADRLAREELSPHRHYSVFPTPCREAVYADEYDAALAINRDNIGKGFSVQTWNIVPAIRDVDRFLREDQSRQDVVRESHPEVCFQRLCGPETVAPSKHDTEGLERRRQCLEDRGIEVPPVPDGADEDDLLDAVVLWETAGLETTTLPADPPTDEAGLPMQIVAPAKES